MSALLSLLAVTGVLTGSRSTLSGKALASYGLDGRDTIPPASLFGEATVEIPFWENPTVLFILAVVAICLLIVLIILVCKKNSERRDYYDINRRMEMERAHMRSGLFDAASDITRASAMYGPRDRRR